MQLDSRSPKFRFCSHPTPKPIRAFKSHFQGVQSATVLTDKNGVAASKVTVIGHEGLGAIFAAIPGTTATAALPADVDPTSKGGKVAAWLVFAGIVAVSIFLVLDALDKDDPVLQPGTATRVAP